MPFDLTISDPLGFIALLKAQTKTFQWVSLIFQMALSATCSFAFACGSALIAKSPTPVAVGYGLISVAIVLSTFFAASPLTRGMMLIRPTAEAAAEINADIAKTTK